VLQLAVTDAEELAIKQARLSLLDLQRLLLSRRSPYLPTRPNKPVPGERKLDILVINWRPGLSGEMLFD
jgi:hypothetical protein